MLNLKDSKVRRTIFYAGTSLVGFVLVYLLLSSLYKDATLVNHTFDKLVRAKYSNIQFSNTTDKKNCTVWRTNEWGTSRTVCLINGNIYIPAGELNQ